jgi:hypothetical protein
METPFPPPKKRGPPLRFPKRIIVFVTEKAHADLEQLARDTDRSLPEVVRSYIRIGLANELDRDEEE